MLSCDLRRLCAATAGASLSLLTAGPAPAQTSETVEEVVVTGLKRSEALQDSAAAITALSATALEARAVRNVQDLQLQAPGLQFADISGTPLIGIRGISLDIVTGAAESPVGVYVDGVYQARPSQTSMNLADLERVEVLRGPQGALYGRNASGGAILFVTRKPQPEFSADLRAGAGSHERRMVGGHVNAPVGDTVAVRLSAAYEVREGFLKDAVTGRDYNDLDSLSGRLAMRWTPSAAATIDLAVFAQRDTMVGPIYQTLTQPFGILPAGSFTLAPRRTLVDAGHVPSARKETVGAAATAAWDIPLGRLTAISGYVRHLNKQFYDADGSSFFLYKVVRPDDSHSFSQEFNLSSPSGSAWDWVVGADVFHEDYDAGVSAPLGPFAFPATQQVQLQDTRTNTFGAFADAKVPLTAKLKLILGARASREKRVARQTQGVDIFGLGFLASCADARSERTDSFVTPRGGLQYEFSSRQMAYAQVTRGYKSGGYNITACGDDFEPEYVTSYEVGYKASFSDGRVTLNAAAFHYDYIKLQVSQIVALPSGASTVNVDNAPGATISGGEVELFAEPVDGLRLSGALTVLDATFDEFVSTDGLRAEVGAPPNEDLSGNRLPRTPKWTASLGAEKAWLIDEFGELTLRAEIFHSAGFYFRPFNRPGDRQSAYTVGNLYVTLEAESGVFARAYLKNATNERYIQELISSEVAGDREGNYAPPRTFGVDLGVRF